VRLFAVAKQTADRDCVEIQLAEGATVAQLREALAAQVPQLAGLVDRMMFAIGTQYAADSTQIPPGADVACIPPVSGG
jgi:molybdopterin synthase catalytic subunit/molybdopterin synthase sulfur carrier subunit